jgi:ABC-type nitrate/sulfonate/bicarbonate transport system permease component
VTRRTSGELTRGARIGYGVIGVVAILAGMQVVVMTGLVPSRSVPLATTMLDRAGRLMVDPEFLIALVETVTATGIAFLLAGVTAIVLGIVIGASELLYRALSGVIDFLRPIPSVALLPVAILLFGLEAEMKIFLAVYAAFWPVLINTMYGVHDVDRVMLSTARGFAWSRPTVMRRVMLPSALPFIATGLRLSFALSLIVVIVAELLAARGGMGAVIRAYQEAGRADYVFAGVLLLGMVGLVLTSLVSAAEGRLVHWAPEQRQRVAT